MPVLEAEPRGWASWSAQVTADGAPLTLLQISTWKSRGRFSLEGEDYQVETQGFWSRTVTLKRGAALIAKATKPSLFRRRFEVTSAGHRMTLESHSWTGRDYVLSLGGREVGRVMRRGVTGRKTTLEFPEEVPLALQLFLLYLVLAQAKRETAAAASGG